MLRDALTAELADALAVDVPFSATLLASAIVACLVQGAVMASLDLMRAGTCRRGPPCRTLP